MADKDKVSADSKYNAVNDTRKFEIGLLWQRSNTFWLFTAAAFGAFFATYDKQHWGFAIIVSNIGFFCTFCWTLANRGSKFWQRNWENLMCGQDENFCGVMGEVEKGWFTRRFSVSKLLIICSDYLTCLWLLILTGMFIKGYISFCPHAVRWWSGWFTVSNLTLAVIVIFVLAKGKDS